MAQKEKRGEIKNVNVSRTFFKIKLLVWYWYWVGWSKFQYREPQFYNRLFQRNTEVQYESKYPTFIVPIGNKKETYEIEYDPKSPLVEYHQNNSDSCCFSSLESVFTASGENNTARDIATLIVE